MRRLRLATIVVVTDSTPTIHQPNNHGTKQRGSRSVELLIIGAGPAGVAAAIHAGRRSISTLLNCRAIEKRFDRITPKAVPSP